MHTSPYLYVQLNRTCINAAILELEYSTGEGHLLEQIYWEEKGIPSFMYSTVHVSHEYIIPFRFGCTVQCIYLPSVYCRSVLYVQYGTYISTEFLQLFRLQCTVKNIFRRSVNNRVALHVQDSTYISLVFVAILFCMYSTVYIFIEDLMPFLLVCTVQYISYRPSIYCRTVLYV